MVAFYFLAFFIKPKIDLWTHWGFNKQIQNIGVNISKHGNGMELINGATVETALKIQKQKNKFNLESAIQIMAIVKRRPALCPVFKLALQLLCGDTCQSPSHWQFGARLAADNVIHCQDKCLMCQSLRRQQYQRWICGKIEAVCVWYHSLPHVLKPDSSSNISDKRQ